MTKVSNRRSFLKRTTGGLVALREPRAPVAPVSLVETRDQDPYPAYAAARALGTVVWDEGMAAWLVLDHKGCAFVETREDLFAEFTGTLQGADRLTGPHEFRLLVGEPHHRLHHYLAQRWLPAAIEPYRSAFVRPIVEQRVTALRAAGRAELWADFAAVVPTAVMGRVIGLPPMDEADLRRAKGFTDAVLAWRHCYGADPTKVAAAVEATRELERAILPVVRARREAPQDDLISGLWEVGPSVVETWDEQDVLDNVKPLFEAGAETTSLLICIGMHLALGDAEIRARIGDGGEPLRRFVEETLRHTTVVHWRARIATRDIELGGVTIRTGDRVHPVNAAANRDPARYPDPDRFDLGRKGYLSHLAFNMGPRHCAGAWLARMEAYEALLALLAVPGLRLDPEAAPPHMSGFVSRTFRPLHVRVG
ncbi:MAG TPA: cytochrome P450 [Chloroflexota bacterium]|nr:cytochrome P450 [Chloroflexota bacterium]